MLLQGATYREILESQHCSMSTISDIKSDLHVPLVCNKAGRKKILNQAEERMFLRAAIRDEVETVPDVKRYIKHEYDKDISEKTIRRIFKAHRFRYYIKRRKPLLSKQNIERRLAWAKAHEHWTKDQWRAIVFCDETQLNIFNPKVSVGRWRRKVDEFNAANFLFTKKSKTHSKMLWGAINYYQRCPLYEIQGTLDAQKYKTILTTCAFPFITRIENYLIDANYPESVVTLMDDNDPKHSSHAVADLCILKGVQTLDWPSQSPDLNPIENVWAMLNRQIMHDNPKGIATADVFLKYQEAWGKIPFEHIQHTIDSIPERCKDVIRHKGYQTRY